MVLRLALPVSTLELAGAILMIEVLALRVVGSLTGRLALTLELAAVILMIEVLAMTVPLIIAVVVGSVIVMREPVTVEEKEMTLAVTEGAGIHKSSPMLRLSQLASISGLLDASSANVMLNMLAMSTQTSPSLTT
jgi:hypothetical protein